MAAAIGGPSLRDLLRGVWAFVSLALAVLIFIGSGDQPPGGLDNFFVPEGGFAAHFLAYGALAFALVMAARPASWQGIAIVVTGAFLYGVANEVHQAFLDERHASVIDALVNLLGAGLGATTARLLIFVTRPH